MWKTRIIKTKQNQYGVCVQISAHEKPDPKLIFLNHFNESKTNLKLLSIINKTLTLILSTFPLVLNRVCWLKSIKSNEKSRSRCFFVFKVKYEEMPLMHFGTIIFPYIYFDNC